jgi:hypothetical protein
LRGKFVEQLRFLDRETEEALMVRYNRALLRANDTFVGGLTSWAGDRLLTDGNAVLDRKRNGKQAQLLCWQNLLASGFWENKTVVVETLKSYLLGDERGMWFMRLHSSESAHLRPTSLDWLKPLLRDQESIQVALYFIVAPPSYGWTGFPVLKDFQRLLTLLLTHLRLTDFEDFDRFVSAHDRAGRWTGSDAEELFFRDLVEYLDSLKH